MDDGRSCDGVPSGLSTRSRRFLLPRFGNLNPFFMPRLILASPEFAHQSCELPDGAWTVGRGRRNQIVIHDDSVSTDHCELLVHGSEVIVCERGSSNGTYVDGVQVKAQSGVRHGQRLRLGRVELIIELDPPTDEGGTGVTAHDDYRRLVGQPPLPVNPAPPFPVIFRPTVGDSADSRTETFAAVPGVQPRPPGPGALEERSRPSRRWSYVVAVILIAAVLLLWLGTR